MWHNNIKLLSKYQVAIRLVVAEKNVTKKEETEESTGTMITLYTAKCVTHDNHMVLDSYDYHMLILA